MVDKTTNYSLFKLLPNNRQIDDRHVSKLIESIKKFDMTENNPIIVNEEMEVIDGQHRLTACKSLNLPVYYTIKKGADINNVISLNTTQKKWRMIDYVQSYESQGNKEYINLSKFANENKLPLSTAALLLNADNQSHKDGISTLQKVKLGSFKITTQEQAEKVIEVVSKIKDHIETNVLTDKLFYRTIYKLIFKKNIDVDRFIGKMAEYGTKLRRFSSSKLYFREIEDIYNYKSTGRVRFY